MDIVSRIKAFINASGLSVSQFADTCEIARPTVSQLLNGRNKKVSDEIISKIHCAYPSLSVMWLMFGEGNMWELAPQDTENSQMDENSKFKMNIKDDTENSILLNNNINADFPTTDNSIREDKSDSMETLLKNFTHQPTDISKEKTMTNKKGIEKEIVNIMVFYSDNSFEVFKPRN